MDAPRRKGAWAELFILAVGQTFGEYLEPLGYEQRTARAHGVLLVEVQYDSANGSVRVVWEPREAWVQCMVTPGGIGNELALDELLRRRGLKADYSRSLDFDATADDAIRVLAGMVTTLALAGLPPNP